MFLPTYNAAYHDWVYPSTWTRSVFGTSLSIDPNNNYILILKTGHYLVNLCWESYANMNADVMARRAVGIDWYPTIADYENGTNLIEYQGAFSICIADSAQTDAEINAEITKIIYLVAGNVISASSFYASWNGTVGDGISMPKVWFRIIRLD